MKIKSILILMVFMTFIGCQETSKQKTTKTTSITKSIKVPVFNADTAFSFIEKQVAFGPRVPNSEAHKKCGDFLAKTLKQFTDTLYIQRGEVKRFDGQNMEFRNFIGSFNPNTSNRVLLAAHWDTRFIADQDPDYDGAILGANDGGSGVGVLLELARILRDSKPEIGIDILLLDVEDQGQPSDSKLPAVRDSWCLGAQYWAKNPHVMNYYAKYGILLDMVGAENAQFKQEGVSRAFAPSVIKKVWDIANHVGYSNHFIYQEVPEVIDDHLYINGIANIPTIDIIEHDPTTEYRFNKHWHTKADDMNNISKPTLKAVGQTLLEVLYREK